MPYIVTMMDRHAPQGRESVKAAVADYEKRNTQHKAVFVAERPDGSVGSHFLYQVPDMTDANLLHAHACECGVPVSFQYETQHSIDLGKAKELAIMEIRAEGPVIAPVIEAWLHTQGGEPVSSLTNEAIQDLLDEKIIEVWDKDEEVHAYGYCGSAAAR